MAKAREQKMAVATVWQSGLEVGYDWEFDADGHLKMSTWNGATWLRNLLGDDFFFDVVEVYASIGFKVSPTSSFVSISDCVATDQNLLVLKTFSRLRSLSLAGNRITDSSMACIAELRGLQELKLWFTNVGDNGIAHLQGLRNLRHLRISTAKVTNSGLVYLKNLPNLESICLGGTAVDDKGLLSLTECRRLKEVNLMWRNLCTSVHAGRCRTIQACNAKLQRDRVAAVPRPKLPGRSHARSRAFPPKAVLDPCFSTGSRNGIPVVPLSAAFGGGQGEQRSGCPPLPDVNVGPNTAFGGKGRERP